MNTVNAQAYKAIFDDVVKEEKACTLFSSKRNCSSILGDSIRQVKIGYLTCNGLLGS